MKTDFANVVLNYDTIANYKIVDNDNKLDSNAQCLYVSDLTSSDIHDLNIKINILEMLKSFTLLLSKNENDISTKNIYHYSGLYRVDSDDSSFHKFKNEKISDYDFTYWYNLALVLVELTCDNDNEIKKFKIPVIETLKLMRLSRENKKKILSNGDLTCDDIDKFQKSLSDFLKTYHSYTDLEKKAFSTNLDFSCKSLDGVETFNSDNNICNMSEYYVFPVEAKKTLVRKK